jgi:predicted Zn-dependent protease
MWAAIAAVATAMAGGLALMLYLLKGWNSPAAQYKAAVAAYKKAVSDEDEIRRQLKDELDKGLPDREWVARLGVDLRLAARRVLECREARDKLRP